MIMKSTIAMVLAVSAISIGGCQKKEAVKVDPVKREVVAVKPTLESLDRRLLVLEQARARANANAKKYSPAPKYDPNYKG